MAIPEFRHDGYLPLGVHLATEEEIVSRFGSGTARRRYLVGRLKRWVELGRIVKALRILVDGSFVTTKPEPDDIDAVIQLGPDFGRQLRQGEQAAVELFQVLTARQPEELFGAEDDEDWNGWVDFFSRTRESSGVRKGLLEIRL
jgi:hypothetical protein